MPKPKSGKIKKHIMLHPDTLQKVERLAEASFRGFGEQVDYLLNEAIRNLESRNQRII